MSQFGSEITAVALPLTALTMLHASAFQLGLLAAVGTASIPLITLPAGVWMDRVRRRPVMVAADLLRFALLGSIPLTAALGMLTLWQMYLVALLAGAATVINDVARMSYLPFLVGRDRLVEGNAVMHTTRNTASSGGPAVGGWLVQLAGPANAILVDAVSFMISACSLGAIRRTEPALARGDDGSLWREIGAGIRLVAQDPVLRMLALSGFLQGLSTTALIVVQPVLLVRDLRVTPDFYGLILAIDAIGGIAGGITASWARRRLGAIAAIWVPSLLRMPFVMLIPFTGHGWLLLLYPAGTFAYSLGGGIRKVAAVSYRQKSCPPELLGRLNATMGFTTWSAIPAGAILGGLLAQRAGTRAALWVVVSVIFLSVLPVLTRKVRRSSEDDPIRLRAAGGRPGVSAPGTR